MFMLSPRVESWYCTFRPTGRQKVFVTAIVSIVGFLIYLPPIMYFVLASNHIFSELPFGLFVLPMSVVLCPIFGYFIASIPDVEPSLNLKQYYVQSISVGIITTTTTNGMLFIGLSKFLVIISLVFFIHMALILEVSLLKKRIIDEVWMIFIAKLYSEKKYVDYSDIVAFCGRELSWGDIYDLIQYFTSLHSIFSLKLDVEVDIEAIIRGVQRRIKQIDDKVFVELCERRCIPDNFRVIDFTIMIPHTYQRVNIHGPKKKRAVSRKWGGRRG